MLLYANTKIGIPIRITIEKINEFIEMKGTLNLFFADSNWKDVVSCLIISPFTGFEFNTDEKTVSYSFVGNINNDSSTPFPDAIIYIADLFESIFPAICSVIGKTEEEVIESMTNEKSNILKVLSFTVPDVAPKSPDNMENVEAG